MPKRAKAIGLTVVASLSVVGWSTIPPSAIGCPLYGATSLECVLARVEEEEAKRQAKPPTTEELVGMVMLTTGIGLIGQHYLTPTTTNPWGIK